jgi:hypothetical protein
MMPIVVNVRTPLSFARSALARLLLTLLSSGAWLAGPAAAQGPPPRLPSPPINDAPPPSPIDGLSVDEQDEQDEKEVVPPGPPRPPPPPRQPRAVWLGWTLGSGYGWHPRRRLERRADLEIDQSFGAGHLGHFGPEVGFQWRDRIALSLQTRHQVIPRQSTDPTRVGLSKQWAHTLLARAVYLIDPDRYRRFRLYTGGVLGVGGGFRFRVEAAPSRSLATSDTVRGGPLVLGPIGGIIYPVFEGLSLVGELRALFGAPDPAGMADLSVGLQFDAFQL